ncbi:hypothetical protein TWF225_009021 [Orbilia oligospora]|uniref:Uncharacterized protein n=1 Tax=Orbilia oligospora TaxID=2813651 RepID=A0A7C8KR89_ORBOL|nr:hypothetical protein TWF751_006223 [Orbilia oligospora]KAF3175123.1 hypothetical protein TWF225_009021 [Orbilia oligospora]KAF3234571.1 hypothetical protein TWF128_002306 [Orbilia oligospora]KAF3248682.1 hypothetical protein TWF217_009041 [Orbilia oligospora]KAF3281737.1 hypothetical protein TWF132_011152 [Orbilia oligospora]
MTGSPAHDPLELSREHSEPFCNSALPRRPAAPSIGACQTVPKMSCSTRVHESAQKILQLGLRPNLWIWAGRALVPQNPANGGKRSSKHRLR